MVTLPTPERVSSLDFEQLSDSIALTKQMLEETSDTFAALLCHGGHESMALRIAWAYEQATTWRERRPPAASI